MGEMLAVMEAKGEDVQPIPFDMTFITCNLKKGTGGKRIHCKDVVLAGGVTSNSSIRNPDRFKNYTRLFRPVANEELRAFHPLLVELFNGNRVVL